MVHDTARGDLRLDSSNDLIKTLALILDQNKDLTARGIVQLQEALFFLLTVQIMSIKELIYYISINGSNNNLANYDVIRPSNISTSSIYHLTKL